MAVDPAGTPRYVVLVAAALCCMPRDACYVGGAQGQLREWAAMWAGGQAGMHAGSATQSCSILRSGAGILGCLSAYHNCLCLHTPLAPGACSSPALQAAPQVDASGAGSPLPAFCRWLAGEEALGRLTFRVKGGRESPCDAAPQAEAHNRQQEQAPEVAAPRMEL